LKAKHEIGFDMKYFFGITFYGVDVITISE